MKRSELVKMIREEVASLLREKNMKRKNIKEVGAVDPTEKTLEDKIKQNTIALRTYQLTKAKAAQAAKPATV